MNLLAPIASGAALMTPWARQGLQALGEAVGGFRDLLDGPSVEDTAQADSTETAADAPDAALQEFHQRLLQQLTDAGLELQEPIEISQSPLGGLSVVNAHPQILDIERILANDASFAQLYGKIADARSEELDGARQLDILWSLDGATSRVR